jgi:fermentation-respiration switch protein FrsA (DUF1100 family)
MMLNIVFGLLLGYAGILGVVYVVQERMLFFPQTGRTLETTPDRHGIPFESLMLSTEDGEKIHAWWIPAVESRGTVLFLHGNAGNIASRIGYVRMFHRLGYSALLVDYRGYGMSTGTPSEAGTYQDAQAAWRYLRGDRDLPAAKIAVLGESLGGGVASWLAAQQQPGALILLSTFTSIPDLAAELYPFLPVRWLSRIRYDSLARLKGGLTTAILVAHSPDDEIVPFAHGKRLYEAASEPRQFLELAGSHNEAALYSRAVWENSTKRFLDKALSDTR